MRLFDQGLTSANLRFSHPTHRPSHIRPGIIEHALSTALAKKPGLEISARGEVIIGDSILRFERRAGGHIGVNKVDRTGRVVERGTRFEFTPSFSFTEPLRLEHFGKHGLLTLSRKQAETIIVDSWHIHVAEIEGDRVKLAIDAPTGLVATFREEDLDLESASGDVSLVGMGADDKTSPREAYPVSGDPKPFPGFIQVLEIKGDKVRLGLSFDDSTKVDRREGLKPNGVVLTRGQDAKIIFPRHKPSLNDVEPDAAAEAL